MLKKKNPVIFVAFLSLIVCSALYTKDLSAAVVYDNGRPIYELGGENSENLSGSSLQAISYDDFIVNSSNIGGASTYSITDAHFWDSELTNYQYSGQFDWKIYAAGGYITNATTPLYSGTSVNLQKDAVMSVTKGGLSFIVNSYGFDLDVPVTLNADTSYFFALTASGFTLTWLSTDQSHGTPSGIAGASPGALDLAFYLTGPDSPGGGDSGGGTTVPEPSTMLLLGSGLIGLIGSSRKGKRTC